jgi:hypothetical protein
MGDSGFRAVAFPRSAWGCLPADHRPQCALLCCKLCYTVYYCTVVVNSSSKSAFCARAAVVILLALAVSVQRGKAPACLRTPGSQQSRTDRKWLDVAGARQLILSTKSFSMKHVRNLILQRPALMQRLNPHPIVLALPQAVKTQKPFPISRSLALSLDPLCAPRPSPVPLATHPRITAVVPQPRQPGTISTRTRRWPDGL